MRNPVTAVDFYAHQRGDDFWLVCPFPGCGWSMEVRTVVPGAPFTIKDQLHIANKHLDAVNGHNTSLVWHEAMVSRQRRITDADA